MPKYWVQLYPKFATKSILSCLKLLVLRSLHFWTPCSNRRLKVVVECSWKFWLGHACIVNFMKLYEKKFSIFSTFPHVVYLVWRQLFLNYPHKSYFNIKIVERKTQGNVGLARYLKHISKIWNLSKNCVSHIATKHWNIEDSAS